MLRCILTKHLQKLQQILAVVLTDHNTSYDDEYVYCCDECSKSWHYGTSVKTWIKVLSCGGVRNSPT